MAVRTWAGALGGAAGTGVAAGAGQLGLAYGLGIIRWNTAFTESAWHFQVTWLTLLPAVAVVMGAGLGRWSGLRSSAGPQPPRAVVALASGAGAAIMIPLVWHPARAARLEEMGSPAVIGVIATAAGLVLGVVAAVAVLSVPTVAGNVVATMSWIWFAAALSAIWTIGRGDTWGSARPGLLPVTGAWVPVLLLGEPALIAFAVAGIARFGGSPPVPVAVSGAAGPILLATAYVIAAPGGGDQAVAYRYALLSIAVGSAVSALVAFVRRPAPGRAAEPDVDRDGPADPDLEHAPAPGRRRDPGSGARSGRSSGGRPGHRFGEHEPSHASDTREAAAAAAGGFMAAATVPPQTRASSRASRDVASRPESDEAHAHGGSWSGSHRLPAWTDVPEDSWPGPDRGSARAGAHADTWSAESEPGTTWPASGDPPPEDAGAGTGPAPGRSKGRRGRKRRDRDDTTQPLTKGDSEYVNWVRTLGGGRGTQ